MASVADAIITSVAIVVAAAAAVFVHTNALSSVALRSHISVVSAVVTEVIAFMALL